MDLDAELATELGSCGLWAQIWHICPYLHGVQLVLRQVVNIQVREVESPSEDGALLGHSPIDLVTPHVALQAV